MKVAWCLSWLLIGLLTAAAQTSFNQLRRVSLFGYEYIRLDDWAGANGFQVQWVVRNEQARAILGTTRLEFDHNSRRVLLNGIAVWLSVPVIARNGSMYVGSVDFRTAIHPVLFPARNVSGKTVKTIVLDPGHGGKDPGNREGLQQEKKYTLLLAKELSDILGKAGFRVSLTRSTDSSLELTDRPEIARRRSADLLVSLHFNSADRAGAKTVQGVETYAMTPFRASSTNARGEGAGAGLFPGNRNDLKNMLLAYQVQKAFVRQLSSEDRGVRRARFAVLRNAEMPAVLVECGFMTHPIESKRIYDPAQRRRMAQAIADGIIAYRSLVDAPKAELRSK